MRKYIILFILIGLISCQGQKNENIKVSVEVDFGKEKQLFKKDVQVKAGATALEALQYACVTETHPVGKYVFVSSINGVVGVPKEKVWYYKVNGVSPKVLAINNSLKDGDVIRWIYKTDVCSAKKNDQKAEVE